MKKIEKLFIVRKYVKAVSAAEAIRLEKKAPVDDVWVDDDWKKMNPLSPPIKVGFKQKKVA